MKKVLLSILAVAAMASCVQSEDVNPQQLIDFGSPFVGGTTKAIDPSYGQSDSDASDGPVALTKFNVYGTVDGGQGVVNLFDAVPVTGTVGGGVWSYADEYKKYWIPGAAHNFAAVVDAATVGQDANKMPTTLTPAKNDGGYLKDLLYAFSGPYTEARVVNFDFDHLLAKAQFVVTSTTEGGYYYKVKGIKIHNFSTGTYEIATETWSTATDKAYELGDIAEVTTTTGAVTNAIQVLLFPTASAFKVEFVVELRNKNGVDAEGNPADVLLRTIDCTGANAKVVEIKNNEDVLVGLQAGYAYNFNLALTSGTEIQFTVTNHPTWTNANVNL